jgi:DEAD/DEAH box helicase domain-containing protein
VTIGCIPLFALADKGDIGGYSYPLYPEFKTPAIFIYDGYEGGMGIARRVIENENLFRDWITAAMDLIRACPCETGCPSCVQDSQCGSSNNPLDKKGALFFLSQLLP